MEGKFPFKLLAFVTATTHNCDSFSRWSQMFHTLPSICEGIILPSEIGFFEKAFLIVGKNTILVPTFWCNSQFSPYILVAVNLVPAVNSLTKNAYVANVLHCRHTRS